MGRKRRRGINRTDDGGIKPLTDGETMVTQRREGWSGEKCRKSDGSGSDWTFFLWDITHCPSFLPSFSQKGGNKFGMAVQWLWPNLPSRFDKCSDMTCYHIILLNGLECIFDSGKTAWKPDRPVNEHSQRYQLYPAPSSYTLQEEWANWKENGEGREEGGRNHAPIHPSTQPPSAILT